MRHIDDDYIARMMCCGGKCEVGPNTGLCHRFDFATEVAKVRALLIELAAERERGQEAEQVPVHRGAAAPAGVGADRP